MNSIDAVRQYLHQQQNRHLAELVEFLRIPSISALAQHRGDIDRAAQWLAARLRAAGFPQVRIDPTPGHPIVRASSASDRNQSTILIYGHYDVQPVDPEGAWTSPPFDPRIDDGILYARGSSDDKGQIFMQLVAAESWLQVAGSLPVNLILLFEGEEEIGSPNLPDYIAAHREELSADVAVISDTPMLGPEMPAICYGLRGMAAFDLHVSGPDHDLHSGVYGGAVANPAHALAELIAALHDRDGRVAVRGFYDDVEALSDSERRAMAQLPFDAGEWPPLFGEPGFSTLERVWTRPTVEVNGMWSGFTGEGRKTIIPASAHAKLTCRLVPRQDPHRILSLIQDYLQAHCPPGVRMEMDWGEGDPGVVTPLDHPAVQAAAAALAEIYHQPVRYIRMGGSIPVVGTFAQELQLPTLLLGFALPNENFHAPNEHFHLNNFHRGAETLATLWGRLGQTE